MPRLRLAPINLPDVNPSPAVLRATTAQEWRRLRAIPVRTFRCDRLTCCIHPHTVIAVVHGRAIRRLLNGCLYWGDLHYHRYTFVRISEDDLQQLYERYLSLGA